MSHLPRFDGGENSPNNCDLYLVALTYDFDPCDFDLEPCTLVTLYMTLTFKHVRESANACRAQTYTQDTQTLPKISLLIMGQVKVNLNEVSYFVSTFSYFAMSLPDACFTTVFHGKYVLIFGRGPVTVTPHSKCSQYITVYVSL